MALPSLRPQDCSALFALPWEDHPPPPGSKRDTGRLLKEWAAIPTPPYCFYCNDQRPPPSLDSPPVSMAIAE